MCIRDSDYIIDYIPNVEDIEQYNVEFDYYEDVIQSSGLIQFLDKENTLSLKIVNNKPYFQFNNIKYDNEMFIGVKNGIYTLNNVTSNNPIGFIVKDQSLFKIISGGYFASKFIENCRVIFYIGDIIFQVNGDFGSISYYHYWHGYVGGKDKLIYYDMDNRLSLIHI